MALILRWTLKGRWCCKREREAFAKFQGGSRVRKNPDFIGSLNVWTNKGAGNYEVRKGGSPDGWINYLKMRKIFVVL